MILQRFHLNLVPGARINREVTITLSPKGGMPMEIQSPADSLRFVPVRGNIHDMVNLEHP
jgi:hypothetical protein